MNDFSDQQLLRDYAARRSEPAFAELVRRHVDLVHSAALRMVCDAHLAEDVTQGAFVALAQNAGSLTERPVLSGWLHRTAQNLAANAVRTEVRRRAREQESVAMSEIFSAEPDARWEDIAPHLDAALGELGETDRDALLLRYFERQSAGEMAQTLGISAEAAQKRVHRAVEKLRELFSKQKITVGAGGLVAVISANAVQAAPAGLAATIILGGTTFQTSTLIAITKTIAMTTLQKSLITAALAIVAGAGIYEAHQAAQLREQNLALLQQQAPLADQIQQLQRERDDATNRAAAAAGQLTRAKKNPTELLKLRGEVGVLKQQKAIADSKSAINKITSNPESRKALREQQKIGMTALYSDLAKSLKLSPEQTGQFNDLLADHVMDNIDLITQTLHDHNSRTEIDQLFSAQDSALHDKLLALVGPDGLAQYQDYEKNLGSTLTAAQFEGNLTGDAATKADKKNQLLQAMREETQAALASAGLPADLQTVPILNFRNIASEAEAKQSMQLLDTIFTQVTARAGAFLTTDELKKLHEFWANGMKSNQTMLDMNRNLMAPISE